MRKLDLDKIDKWILFIGLVVFIIVLVNPPAFRYRGEGVIPFGEFINWGKLIVRLLVVGGITIGVYLLRRCI